MDLAQLTQANVALTNTRQRTAAARSLPDLPDDTLDMILLDNARGQVVDGLIAASRASSPPPPALGDTPAQ